MKNRAIFPRLMNRFQKAFVLAGTLLVFVACPSLGQTESSDRESPGSPGAARVSAPTRPDELQPVPVPEPSAKAMEFYRTSNWLWVFNVVWAILLTGTLAFSGASARLRSLAQRLGGNWFLSVGLYVLLYLAVVFLVNLPLSFYQGYLRLHAYGLSNQTLGKWFGDKVIGLAVMMAVGFAFSWVPYLLIARSPRRWWLYTGLLAVPFLFATMMVEPIWIDPLFNKFGPMKNQALERSILALAERGGSTAAGCSRSRRASIPTPSTPT